MYCLRPAISCSSSTHSVSSMKLVLLTDHSSCACIYIIIGPAQRLGGKYIHFITKPQIPCINIYARAIPNETCCWLISSFGVFILHFQKLLHTCFLPGIHFGSHSFYCNGNSLLPG